MICESTPVIDNKKLPAPTPEMLENPTYKAIWEAIKGWEISTAPADGELHTGAMGNHARAIYDRVKVIP